MSFEHIYGALPWSRAIICLNCTGFSMTQFLILRWRVCICNVWSYDSFNLFLPFQSLGWRTRNPRWRKSMVNCTTVTASFSRPTSTTWSGPSQFLVLKGWTPCRCGHCYNSIWFVCTLSPIWGHRFDYSSRENQGFITRKSRQKKSRQNRRLLLICYFGNPSFR